MKTPSEQLMSSDTSILCLSSKGYAYVINSEGKTGNIVLSIVVWVNTIDNTTKVRYEVNIFVDNKADKFTGSYTDYTEALNKYNELVMKWSAYRDELQTTKIQTL